MSAPRVFSADNSGGNSGDGLQREESGMFDSSSESPELDPARLPKPESCRLSYPEKQNQGKRNDLQPFHCEYVDYIAHWKNDGTFENRMRPHNARQLLKDLDWEDLNGYTAETAADDHAPS